MIQRIQTVYLALVVILSFVSLVSGIGEFRVGTEVVATFSNFGFSAIDKGCDTMGGPWALGVLLIMVVFLSLITILLFRKRMRQLRFTIISTILLVGYVATYAMFAIKYQGWLAETYTDVAPEFHLCIIGMFPVICIILNCLAIHGIRKDEALVRSLDRLR